MTLEQILGQFGVTWNSISPFLAEEDGRAYNVWKIETDKSPLVLKKTTREEQEVYETFFPGGGDGVPRVYGFFASAEELYMLMEFVPGQTLSRCDRHRLTLALDALITIQERFWDDTEHAHVGYGYHKSLPNREKRLPFLKELAPAYEAYLQAFRTVPRTLCNDDLLPFNVLASDSRAVILDWEYAGILPYPCALARLIAFGEETADAMFHMTRQDQQFAADYYYEHLVRSKGIGYDEYIRTLKLFFFKEYSEWVYCANSSGEPSVYYEPYYALSRKLAAQMGYLSL